MRPYQLDGMRQNGRYNRKRLMNTSCGYRLLTRVKRCCKLEETQDLSFRDRRPFNLAVRCVFLKRRDNRLNKHGISSRHTLGLVCHEDDYERSEFRPRPWGIYTAGAGGCVLRIGPNRTSNWICRQFRSERDRVSTYLKDEEESSTTPPAGPRSNVSITSANMNRIKALREVALRIARSSDNDFIPELEAVAPDELHTLFEQTTT